LARIVAFEVDEGDESRYSTDAFVRVATLYNELRNACRDIVVERREL
jgi:hypothetical protein